MNVEKNQKPRVTQEIRNIFNAFPGITAKEVVAKLAAKGIGVHEGFVESVKIMMAKPKLSRPPPLV
jgi:hypothetical protein